MDDDLLCTHCYYNNDGNCYFDNPDFFDIYSEDDCSDYQEMIIDNDDDDEDYEKEEEDDNYDDEEDYPGYDEDDPELGWGQDEPDF